MVALVDNIEKLLKRVILTWRILDIDGKKKENSKQEKEMNKPGFWDDRERAVDISRQVEEIDKEIGVWENLKSEIKDLKEIAEISVDEEDKNVSRDLEKKYKELEKDFEKLEFQVLFSEKFDDKNAIISIHSGAGGVDAQDWAQILERMFLRFCEKKNWKAEILDRTVGQEAGIKSMTLRVAGRWAYGYLKSESGVHRLVRISPFDAEGMRHTSFALVEVIPELPEAEEIELSDDEIKIDVYKSSGPGGQGVNTTDSAVRITHKPTKIVVSCQNERSQHQNKESAIKILKSKLFKLRVDEKEKQERKLRGEAQKAEWGNQIRSYVMQPYKMVKDHRTNYETQNVEKVLDGDLEGFMEEYLRWAHNT